MFKTITRTVAAALLVMSAPLSAEAVTRLEFVERLQNVGIELTSGECDGAFGMYSPSKNLMCINDKLFEQGQQNMFDETITHEAVHVIQDCLAEGGIQGNTLIPMITAMRENDMDTSGLVDYVNKNLTDAYADYISEIKEPVVAVAETEAYALESNPDLVYNLLGSMCTAE
jgi:hypothetical protein